MRLILGLELYAGRKINPDNTLIIFDEVQEVPRALASLKYFYENASQYHIVCAVSLLGIALHNGTSFPVGKVGFLRLYPLSFKEFLMAMGNELFVEFKGALTEQYVLQQRVVMPSLNIYYYTNDRGSCEIDFLIDDGERVVPVEVKAEVIASQS